MEPKHKSAVLALAPIRTWGATSFLFVKADKRMMPGAPCAFLWTLTPPSAETEGRLATPQALQP